MYVAVIPNRSSPPAILLRESYSEYGKTKKRTLKNLSDWPAERIEQLRAVLRGEELLPATNAVEIVRSLPHGHPPGPPPPEERRPAALRCHLHLPGRALLRTGATWPQPRPPARSRATGHRPALRR